MTPKPTLPELNPPLHRHICGANPSFWSNNTSGSSYQEHATRDTIAIENPEVG